jgi:hypothetical protein
VEAARGFGKTEFFSDGLEIAEMAELHGRDADSASLR